MNTVLEGKKQKTVMIVSVLIGVICLSVMTCINAAEIPGKISKNFYRIPYGNRVDVRINQDYIHHGETPAGGQGPMDLWAHLVDQPLVAGAAGIVIEVRDHLDDCGCNSQYGGCANFIRIMHANGERSDYVHIVQHSATVDSGDTVYRGQVIATEGNVGFTCGDGEEPRAGTCLDSIPDSTRNCLRHLHWSVRRVATNEFVNPMICGISNNIFQNMVSYTGADCSTTECDTDQDFTVYHNFSGYGTFYVYQADNSIQNSNTFEIQDSASVVFHAGSSITLKPGFHARSKSYFRAEIGACNSTLNADDF
ncbi:MAG: M23 family metallopeptidase [FCB group bacterium]|nr:M23 family metallopeptidase [FCB group bacterium]